MATQKLTLPYGAEKLSLEIDEKNLLALVQPMPTENQCGDEDIRRAIRNPIGSKTLSQLAGPGARVAILIDDNTRPTPAHRLLPLLMNELRSVGVSAGNITIVIAGGTHRPMTDEEIRLKVGAKIQSDYRVVNHLWKDETSLVRIGETEDGTPVDVNRIVVEADLCIGVGNIAPHPLCGWSGGGKIIEPGICGCRTTASVHGRLAYYPVTSFLGVVENPVRAEIDRVARKAGLRFILNTVLDGSHQLAGVFAGDPVKAHREGIKLAQEIWTQGVPGPADIVVASSYPADLDFWQAQKTLHFMELAVKRGGDCILVTPCPEGIAAEELHRRVILEYSHGPSRDILAQAKAQGELDLAAITVAVHVALTRELADVTIVSHGLSEADCESMGFRHCRDLGRAFTACMAKHGPDAQVILMTQGPTVIPMFEEINS